MFGVIRRVADGIQLCCSFAINLPGPNTLTRIRMDCKSTLP